MKGKRSLGKPTSKWKQQKEGGEEGRKNKGKSEEQEAKMEDREIL